MKLNDKRLKRLMIALGILVLVSFLSLVVIVFLTVSDSSRESALTPVIPVTTSIPVSTGTPTSTITFTPQIVATATITITPSATNPIWISTQAPSDLPVEID